METREALAMVFEQPKAPFVAHQIEFPPLNKGEVLVKTIYTTLCTSDLHTYYGRRISPVPSILGHEIIGQIVHLPPGEVTDYYGHPLRMGDRITWAVYAHHAHCRMTQKGLPQKSEGLYKYGHEVLGTDNTLNGGFATHCHLQQGSTIFKLPPTLSPQEAAPLNCTHATVAGAVRLAGDLQDKTVLVSGAGMLGLSACAMAKEQGAHQVWVSDITETRVRYAQCFGADGWILANQGNDNLKKQTIGKEGIDVIIETSGAPSAVEKGVDLLTIGGTAVLIGSVFSQRNISINAEQIVRKLLTIKGLHNYIPQDLASAINFLQRTHSIYPFKALVGKEFPLQQLKAAFEEGNQGRYYRIGVYPTKPEPFGA
ncbi:MAG: zinc-binding dehydrogenase [Cyclobacteriaceae bacterium]